MNVLFSASFLNAKWTFVGLSIKYKWALLDFIPAFVLGNVGQYMRHTIIKKAVIPGGLLNRSQ